MLRTQAAFLQNQWLENLGIDVTINPKVTKDGSADRKNGNYQMSITGWSPDYNDPMTFLDMWTLHQRQTTTPVGAAKSTTA